MDYVMEFTENPEGQLMHLTLVLQQLKGYQFFLSLQQVQRWHSQVGIPWAIIIRCWDQSLPSGIYYLKLTMSHRL